MSSFVIKFIRVDDKCATRFCQFHLFQLLSGTRYFAILKIWIKMTKIYQKIFEKFVGAKLANIFFILLSASLVIGVILNFWLNNQFDVIGQPLIVDKEEYVSEEQTKVWKKYSSFV